MEGFSAYDLMLDVGFISLLMIIGNVLRHRVKFFFQDLLLPAPVTAGLLGLLLGPNVLNVVGFSENLGSIYLHSDRRGVCLHGLFHGTGWLRAQGCAQYVGLFDVHVHRAMGSVRCAGCIPVRSGI